MPFYRLANPAPVAWNILKTLIAIALFDAIVVGGLPTLILTIQHADTGLDLFFPPQIELGEVVLALGTLMVVWAGMTLAIRGEGTPLAFNSPRRLVISGPYAWLRTPMVTGTMGQIIGVGIITGSVLVIALFALVGLIWNTFIRPTEEEVLQRIFGREFELYRRSVRCWLPMRSPWRRPSGYSPVSVSDVPDDTGRQRKRPK